MALTELETEKQEAGNRPTLDEDWLWQLDKIDIEAKRNILYLIKSFAGCQPFEPLTLKNLIAFTMNIYKVGYKSGLVRANKDRTYIPVCNQKEYDWLLNELKTNHKEGIL